MYLTLVLVVREIPRGEVHAARNDMLGVNCSAVNSFRYESSQVTMFDSTGPFRAWPGEGWLPKYQALPRSFSIRRPIRSNS